MEKNLPVSYKSEEDPDGNLSTMDCGPSCLAMILDFYNPSLNLTTNQITQYLDDLNGITLDQLQKAATNYGFNAEVCLNQDFGAIKARVDKGVPVLVLVHAGSLQSRQDKNYIGGHYILVVGYRADNSLYVNDPDFYGDLRKDGDHHVYTYDEFMKAWNDCTIDGNMPFQFLVVYPKAAEDTSFPAKISVTSDLPLRARTAPTINTQNIAKKINKGTILDVIGKATGDSVGGNSTWFEIRDNPNPLFVWSGAVAELTTDPIPPESDNVTTPTDQELIDGLTVIFETSRNILVSRNALPGQTSTNKQPDWLDKIKAIFNI